MKKFVFTLTVLLACLNLHAKTSTFKIKDPSVMKHSYIELDTNWDFYWGKFIPPYDTSVEADLVVSVPSDWNKYQLSDEINQITKTGKGAGTYRLKIVNLRPNTEYAFPVFEIAYTAFTVYCGSEVIYKSGTPSTEWEHTVAEQYFDKAVFKSDINGTALLTIYVSNDFYRKGGLRHSIKLYEAQTYHKIHIKDLSTYGIFSGILIMIIIYGFLIFLMKKEKTNLYLALLILSVYSRIISSTFPLLKLIFPSISLELLLRIEYISVFFIPGFITLYIDALNKNIFSFIPAKVIFFPSLVFLVLDFALPISIVNRMVPIMQIYMYTVMGIDILLFIINMIKERDITTILAELSFVIIALGASSDILTIHHVELMKGLDLLMPSFVLFALCQIALLAYIQNKNYLKVIELNEHLYQTNQAYYRFVPKEFLELLSKKDITEVKLGEYRISKAAVLSADIRNFTSTSEKLAPIQVFDMLNSYLKKVAPLIRKYNGIIEKYLGDGIIAIFPDSAEAAINCAVEMQEQMIELREEFSSRGMPQIKIGIGIHYGNIVIGTGGNSDRMTEIALSDDIEIAVKTESKTKLYHMPILATYQAVNNAAYEARQNGRKFSFYGTKIKTDEHGKPFDLSGLSSVDAASTVLFSIYNEKTGNVL